jgi:hypothetical protein
MDAKVEKLEKGLTTASVADTMAVISEVVLPPLGKGVLISHASQ